MSEQAHKQWQMPPGLRMAPVLTPWPHPRVWVAVTAAQEQSLVLHLSSAGFQSTALKCCVCQ